MDWKLVTATFSGVFLAEMGDKTQLATLLLSARSGKPGQVFLAATAALTVATTVGAVVGKGVAHLLPEPLLGRSVATVFIVVGIWMWVRS